MRLLMVSMLFLVSACGGGGGSTPTPPPPPPPPPPPTIGGIWVGTDSAGGPITVIVDKAGTFFSLALDSSTGCNGFTAGAVITTGSSFTASGTVGLTVGCAYPDGSVGGTVAITGTFIQNSTITGTATVTTAKGTVEPSVPVNLSFNSLYLEPSSTAKISGNYWDGTATLSIDSAGVLFEQDANGCVLNGSFTPEVSVDVYTVSETFSNCPNLPPTITLTGLAFLDDQVSPAKIFLEVTVSLPGEEIFLAAELPHQ
jgi:hypothetical protein